MIDTPKFPDNNIKVPPGAMAPKITGHGASTIQQIKPDMLLNAVVARHDGSGNPVLRTPVGDITVSTKLQLLQGSNVVLKVLVNNKVLTPPPNSQLPYNFQAKIVTIDGHPPSPPASSGQTTATPSAYNMVTALAITSLTSQYAATSQATGAGAASVQTPAQSVAADAAIVNVSNGMILDSVVIDVGRDAAAYMPKASSVIKPSDGVVLHVLSTKVPEGVQQAAQQNTQTDMPKPLPTGPTGAQISNPSLANIPQTRFQPSGNIPYSTTAPPPTILPGQELPAYAAGKGDVPTQTSQITANPTFTGIVVGTEKSGEAVLKTPLGILKLEASVVLSKGTELTLEVVRHNPASGEGLVVDRAGDLGIKTLLNEQRLIMTELITAAMKSGEEVMEAVKAKIPAADKQMIAKLLWFLAGVKKGDERFWLGRNLSRQFEQAGNGELLNSMKGHFGSLGRLAEGMPNSNWNLFLFPFFDGQHLQHGLMYMHRFKEDKDKKDKEGKRFIVELDLSSTGQMQIDGFIKETRDIKELDIFIRTKNNLDAEFANGIREIFMETIEIMGINGNIQFQVVQEFPVSPSEELGDEVTEMGTILA